MARRSIPARCTRRGKGPTGCSLPPAFRPARRPIPMADPMTDDGYAQWYADRLWTLLPAIYRALDTGAESNGTGALRELINRIGAQAAVIRRSIDRLGENQSIETCDDWVIPYIGDLVATRLVACLPPPAQRIDVAKTIYYRRRAGTVGLLEELAADIISRDARVVEFRS